MRAWMKCPLLIGALTLVPTCASPAPRTPSAVSVRALVMEHPAYREVQEDATLDRQFQQYVAWLEGLQIPDVTYLASLPADDLEHVAMRFHEKVELRGWLRLGHAFEDVVDAEYYKRHYEEVYPVAHAEAMTAELDLLEAFAKRVGIEPIPARAFVLVGPMVERRGVTPAMTDRRLKFNATIAKLQPTRADLERAARVYEAGGYRYRDRQRVLDEAWAALTAPTPVPAPRPTP